MQIGILSAATVAVGMLSAGARDPGPPDAPPARIGRTAPEFALRGLDDRVHKLSDHRGRTVVLEWTSHLCPAVNGWYDSGAIQAARERTKGDAAWLSIDSGFFAEAVIEGARTWQKARSLQWPRLVDPSGEVGRAYGASATPQFFVINPEGVLIYRGLLQSGRPGDADPAHEYVIEAVAAARAGRMPTTTDTRPAGCSVKYAAKPLSGEALGREIFDWAAGYANEGMLDGAVDLLRGACAVGYATPSDVLKDTRFRRLRDDATAGRRLQEVLREVARESRVTMVDGQEPGRPIAVAGVIRDAEGRGVPGALVHVFQTDDSGHYTRGGMDESAARLSAWLKTDDQGRFEYRTIRPGHYPVDPNPSPNEGRGAQGIEQHVHYEVSAAGFKPRMHRLGFRDDPHWKRTGETPPRWAAEVVRGADGVDRCAHEITIERD